MRIQILSTLAALFASTAAYSQVVGFSGPYDVVHWTTSAPIGGGIDTSSAPTSVTVVGPDQNSGGDIDFTIATVATGNVSFNWSYNSTDDVFADKAYWLRNGNATYLHGNESTTGTGSVSFTANQGDVIGFRVYSTDGGSGPAVLTITGFSAVPEPETYALVATIPLLGFAAYRRQRALRSSRN